MDNASPAPNDDSPSRRTGVFSRRSARHTTPPQVTPIYAGTSAYAQRLERRRQADDRRLQVGDLVRFLGFLRPFWRELLISFALTIGVGLCALPLPFAMQLLIDRVFRQHQWGLMVSSLVLVAAILLLQDLLLLGNRFVQNLLSRRASLTISLRFYRHVQELPLSFYDGLRTSGQVISRFNEISSAQSNVIGVVLALAINGVLSLVYIGVLLSINWKLSLIGVAMVPVYLGVTVLLNRRVRRTTRKALERYAIMSGAMYEGLTGLKTVKSLAATNRLLRQIRRLVLQANAAGYDRDMVSATQVWAQGSVTSLGTVALLGVGGWLVIQHQLTAGQLTAYFLIAKQLEQPVKALFGANQQVQAAAVAVDRFYEVLDEPTERDGEAHAVVMPPIQGELEFDDVTFSYKEGEPVLHNISFRVPAGSSVALVGRSGAGKTTMSNLLLRFYSPEQGRVLIDGIDVRRVAVNSLRSQMGVILQDASLFSGTIRENLTFGTIGRVSDEELMTAARDANILDFIESLPDGFDTLVNERGNRLSGGQRQRLALARMFLRQPRILVLDEPSSALDTESEAKIQESLRRLMAGRTTLVIAHRLSTIQNADQILVIDEGRLVEQGRHEELLAARGVYWRLYSQYGRL